MAITSGKYKGRVVGQAVLGESSKKGTPFLEFYGEITQGENKGGRARYTGYLPLETNPKAAARTVEALQLCGWEGEDLGEFADGELHGLDKNEVEFVIELEEYESENEETGETEKKVSPRIQWINSAAGYLNVQNAMPKEKAASFGEKMRGLVLKMKQKQAPPSEAGDFDFGANEKPAEEPKKASGAKRGW